MCHYREEGGGPIEAMYARLQRNIRQNAADILALEATVRRRQRRIEELRAQVAASEQRLVWLQAELVSLGAELKRLRARARGYKYICFLSLLALLLLAFSLTASVKKRFKN